MYHYIYTYNMDACKKQTCPIVYTCTHIYMCKCIHLCTCLHSTCTCTMYVSLMDYIHVAQCEFYRCMSCSLKAYGCTFYVYLEPSTWYTVCTFPVSPYSLRGRLGTAIQYDTCCSCSFFLVRSARLDFMV